MIVTLKPAYLDREQAAAFVSLSSPTMEGMVRSGNFPAPRQLSPQRVAWKVSELEAWCDARPVSNLPPPRNTGSRRGARQATATPAPPTHPSARPGA